MSAEPIAVCACPRRSARECLRVRSGLDLREMLGDDIHPAYADEECECSCHYEDADEECDEW